MGRCHQRCVLLPLALTASLAAGCGDTDPWEEPLDEDAWVNGGRAPQPVDDSAVEHGSADDVAAPSGDDEPLPDDLADLEVQAEWHDEHLGNYRIEQPGIYRMRGTVEANLEVDLATPGDVVIEGVGHEPVLQGLRRPDDVPRHVSHVQGQIPAGHWVYVRGFTLRNHRQNAMEFGGLGDKTIRNVKVISHTREINGKLVQGAGGINAGTHSSIENCRLHPGDDAIKPTEPFAFASGVTARMYGNGSAIQFGWNHRGDGPTHHVYGMTVRGWLDTNPNHPNPNRDNNVGRSVIAGHFKNDVSDIQITGLKVHGKSYARLIKLVADGAVVDKVRIHGQLLDGLSNKTDAHGREWKQIVLVAKNGGRITDCRIDLGAQAGKDKFHAEYGNVSCKYVH